MTLFAHPERLLAAAALAASVLPAAAQPAAIVGDRLACAAPFGPKSSHTEVVAAFGKLEVAFEKVDGAEGEEIQATVVHPHDAARRLELTWADDKKRSGLLGVRFSEQATWIAPNGVKHGMSVAEVEKMNGRPFALSGFNWDYGGYVTDWKGGALDAALPGGCTVQVRFSIPDDLPDAVIGKVSGDRTFTSSDKAVRAAKPVVGVLGFGYPQP